MARTVITPIVAITGRCSMLCRAAGTTTVISKPSKRQAGGYRSPLLPLAMTLPERASMTQKGPTNLQAFAR